MEVVKMIRAHRAPAWYSIAGIVGGIGITASGIVLGVILVIMAGIILKLAGA